VRCEMPFLHLPFTHAHIGYTVSFYLFCFLRGPYGGQLGWVMRHKKKTQRFFQLKTFLFFFSHDKKRKVHIGGIVGLYFLEAVYVCRAVLVVCCVHTHV
jgi:hypothetical protein